MSTELTPRKCPHSYPTWIGGRIGWMCAACMLFKIKPCVKRLHVGNWYVVYVSARRIESAPTLGEAMHAGIQVATGR